MSLYNSADLLRRCQRMAQAPLDDTVWQTQDWWDALTDAQAQWLHTFAGLIPELGYGPPTLLTTTDGGNTYTFGLDAFGQPLLPMGGVALYRTAVDATRAAGASDYALTPGVDFHVEGALVRFPSVGRIVFPDGAPYAVYATPAGQIDGANEPSMQPPHARMLLVYDAVTTYAQITGRRDPQITATLSALLWRGNTATGQVGLLGALRTQYHAGGAIAGLTPSRANAALGGLPLAGNSGNVR